ncbi:hypothetical protein [Rhizobium sp. Root1220]|uniref:hypothetical protein n=1 Tax=Rhizobium sp. Root1220 TaxID=1736432 RepID=UPI00070099B8|nr:hypothetical protein [Rhizobium sp. Root1220]KQV78185.1 hypothetical protein ASC90_27045 [Rhizobium sp. Root1220]
MGVDWENPYERVIVEAWCAGLVILTDAAKILGSEPEAVVEQARAHGLQLPEAALEMFRIQDGIYSADNGKRNLMG